MKLLTAGLATGLLLAGAPVWADSWTNESGRELRAVHWEQSRGHWERHHRHRERSARHWEHHHRHYGHHHYYWAPPVTRQYYYRDYYSYGYPSSEAYITAPGVYFSWSND